MISIVLVDDHKIVRQGLKELLEMEPDFKVVGEADDGDSGLKITHQLQPDILLSDLMMDMLDGLQLTNEVSKRCKGTKTIILSMNNDFSYVSRALQEGARGYVLKEAGIDALVTAIRQVTAGAIYICPGIRKNGEGKQLYLR